MLGVEETEGAHGTCAVAALAELELDTVVDTNGASEAGGEIGWGGARARATYVGSGDLVGYGGYVISHYGWPRSLGWVYWELFCCYCLGIGDINM